MKSQANALLHVLTEFLLGDVLSAYPALEGIDLDVKRIALYCQTRGLALFTLDLPNLDAILLDGLENGRLRLSGPLTRRVSKKVKVPRLFSGLWLRVFDRDACLRQEVDITALYFLRQIACLGKKISVECSEDRVEAVLEEYHNVERELRRPSLDWDADILNYGSIATIANLVIVLSPAISSLIKAFGSRRRKTRKPKVSSEKSGNSVAS
jgi:hypothetical protein